MRELTIPDLVLLSLLAERPMHGYQANQELERRQVRDWAGISRPQIYYSLDKLAQLGLIHAVETGAAAAGPERRMFVTSSKGRAALARALEREDWALQRERPPFLTWLALSWQAKPKVFMQQVRRRENFLRKELEREQQTLQAIKQEVGHEFHEAVWMVSVTIDHFQMELKWLEKLAREHRKRGPAKYPAIVRQLTQPRQSNRRPLKTAV